MRARGTALAVAAVLFCAGCGGDSDGGAYAALEPASSGRGVLRAHR